MIQIVGNVLKDVYLSIDPRTEFLEHDKAGVEWLNLGFNASEHHYYHRLSTFGGAAISLEVLTHLGLIATINDSDFRYSDTGPTKPSVVDSYRYILTTDDNATYFTPSRPAHTHFTTPDLEPNYLYLDRSAHINTTTAPHIAHYLSLHPNTKLILYLASPSNSPLTQLIPRASLIFTESTDLEGTPLADYDRSKIVFLSESAITASNITEPITVDRVSKRTRLSLYSILSATIFGCFVKGYSIEESLRLARLNVEHSPLDTTLTLDKLKSLHSASPDDHSLELITAALMVHGKGILAADESGGSIHRKFEELNIPDDYQHRHDYRNIFFTTKDIEKYLSGIILFDETARDHMDDLTPIPDYLTSLRIIPGIKVDQGLIPLRSTDETVTKGLDGLPKRLAEYYNMGLRFAKWRAAFTITKKDGHLVTPSSHAIEENSARLAEYAAYCQRAGLVPIVEPEVVYDGDYDIATCSEVTTRILDSLASALISRKVNLRACIYKINMVQNGKKYHKKSTPAEVAEATSVIMNTNIPTGLGGVVFLSGGQTPSEATANLAAIIEKGPYPFPVTFSFARALQDPALHAWAGDEHNTKKAREAFLTQLESTASALKSHPTD